MYSVLQKVLFFILHPIFLCRLNYFIFVMKKRIKKILFYVLFCSNISHSMTDSMQSVEQVRPDKDTRKKDYFRSESPTHDSDGFFDR